MILRSGYLCSALGLAVWSALGVSRLSAADDCENEVRVVFQAEPLGSSSELLFGATDDVEVTIPLGASSARHTVAAAISSRLEPCDVGIEGICVRNMTDCTGREVTCRGIGGWSLVIALDGDLALVDASVKDANPAISCQPMFRVTNLIDPTRLDPHGQPQGQGLVSTVVFFCGEAVTLNPHGTESVLAITLEAERPIDGEVASGRLSCRDGLAVGDSPPSENSAHIGAEAVPFCECRDITVRFVPAVSSPFIRCDANDTGGLEIADAVAILHWLFRRGPGPSCLPVADCDGDGGADVTDAIYAILHLFAGGSPPPPPLPACGVPEEDAVLCERGPRSCE